jgi:hypothetical protein
MGRSAVSGNGIVTDGLMLALDAANPKSITQTSSFSDLSSNSIPVIYQKNTTPSSITLQNGYLYFSSSAAATSNFLSGSYYYTQDSRIVNLTSSLTLETCVYPLEIGPSLGCRPVSPRYTETNSPIGFGIREGRIDTEINTTTGWNTASTITSLVGVNKWVYLTQTTSDANKIMKTYINGILVKDQSFTGTPSSGNGYAFGRGYYGGKWDYNGYIAFVRIYSRVLSPDEILQNYNATKTRFGI